jgi:D-xylose transport system ATP-binding protein
VILISHNLEDVLRVADSIAVLRLGVMVGQPDRKDVTSQELVELITTGRSSRRAPAAPAEA